MEDLTDEVREKEAETLRLLYEQHTRLKHGPFAAAVGIKSASMVWQYLSGHRPLNVSAAARFARGLQVRIGQFSPRLEAEARLIAGAIDPSSARKDYALAAAEPNPTYGTSWPFSSLSPERFSRMSELQRGIVEGLVLKHVLDWEAKHPRGKD